MAFVIKVLNYLRFRFVTLQRLVAISEAKVRWYWFLVSHFWGIDKVRNRDLIVSLTTIPSRFSTVRRTLKTILTQSYRPGEIRVFIEANLEHRLREEIEDLLRFGIEVVGVEPGLGAFNKLIPQIRMGFSADYFIYLDDDVIYPRKLFKSMIRTSQSFHDKAVVANWGQICSFDSFGNPMPYRQWPSWRKPGLAPKEFLPLGVAGVLLPRNLTPRRLQEFDEFSSVCPYQDDLGNFVTIVMNRLQVVLNRKVQRIPITWPNSQDQSLWKDNVSEGANDVVFARLLNLFPEIRQRLLKQ